MQVGSVGHSWGTSRLWHDPEYEVTRDYRPIPIYKGLPQGEALPAEEHVPPPAPAHDPYQVQERVYDVAAAQMESGIQGRQLLHGRPAPSARFDAAVESARRQVAAEGVTRTMVAEPRRQVGDMLGASVKPVEVSPAPTGSVPQSSGATRTATEREATQAVKDARDTSKVMDAAAFGVGGVVATVGAVKAAASAQAVSSTVAAGSVTSATAATGAGGAALSGHAEPEGEELLPSRRR